MFVNPCFLAVNPFIDAFWVSDWLGKGIFFALFALSVFTWVIAIYKIIILNKANKQSQFFYNSLKNQKGNILQWEGSLEKSPFSCLFSSVKKQTGELLIKNRPREAKTSCLSAADMDFLEAHLATDVYKERRFLEKYLFILSMVVTLAPFLGLLGTVWGILGTFSDLQSHSGGIQEMALSGLSLALTTTVLGLIDAIPALISYSWLKASIESFDADMLSFSRELLASIELQYRQVDVRTCSISSIG